VNMQEFLWLLKTNQWYISQSYAIMLGNTARENKDNATKLLLATTPFGRCAMVSSKQSFLCKCNIVKADDDERQRPICEQNNTTTQT
jgi:hypothetical protein